MRPGRAARTGHHGGRSITNPDQQVRALAAVTSALAEAGQHEQATALARSITDPGLQVRALAAVAVLCARAGQHEQATAIARSITNPDQQAQALAAVTSALAARGDTRQARQVASAACAVGRWTTVLGLVLSLEQSAVRDFTALAILSTGPLSAM